MPSPRNAKAADRRPTWVSLTFAALTEADDFATVPDLCRATGAKLAQCTAALHHLRLHRAVDCLSSDGQLFWFATPADDQRTRTVEARVPEAPGTRHRRKLSPRKPARSGTAPA